MQEQISIRPLESDDRLALWQFTTQCGTRTQGLFRPIPDFYSLSGVAWFMGIPKRRCFVAENPVQEIVGLAYYIADGESASFGICVCDRYQRQGIGNRLMEALEDDARNRGFKEIITSGGTHTEGMLRGLLRKRGYTNKGFIEGSSTQILKAKQLQYHVERTVDLQHPDSRAHYKEDWEDIWSNPHPWGTPTVRGYWYTYLFGLLHDRHYNRVLDVGCGDGEFTDRLTHIGSRVVGLDISAQAIALASAECRGKIEFVCGDLRDIDPLEQFDLVCCIDSLYYLPQEELEPGFLKMWGKVASGGDMVVTVHNVDGASAMGTMYLDAVRVYDGLVERLGGKRLVSERYEKVIYILEKCKDRTKT